MMRVSEAQLVRVLGQITAASGEALSLNIYQPGGPKLYRLERPAAKGGTVPALQNVDFIPAREMLMLLQGIGEGLTLGGKVWIRTVMDKAAQHRDYVPEEIKESLGRYLVHGVMPGDFLTACLENNFVDAVCRADETNYPQVGAIARYIYNEMPSHSWGSKEKVKAWAAKMTELRVASKGGAP